MTAVGWDTLGAPMGGQAGYWHGRAIEAERRLAALTEQKAPVEVEGLVERLRRAVPVLRSWGMNSTAPLVDEAATALQSQATELATLKQQLAESTPSPDTEGVRLAVRHEVAAFALLMERKLRANDHKPGWKADNPFDLAIRVEQEASELLEVTSQLERQITWRKADGQHDRGNGWSRLNERGEREVGAFYAPATGDLRDELITKTTSEAADVANMAMMVADVCGALKSSPPVSTVDEEGGGA